MTRTRSGKGSDVGSGNESDARSSPKKGGSSSGSSGKVRRADHKSLVRTAWTLVKQVFFTLVHIYKSMTAFWSQMHVCMLPALGELDHEQEQQEQEQAEQDALAAAGGASSGGSPQRKRATKVN